MSTAPYAGSPLQYDVVAALNTMVTMRDGVCLATDVYFLAQAGIRARGVFPSCSNALLMISTALGGTT